MKRLREGDAGFTLIELLIVIVILGVIAVPLSNFVASYFQNTTQDGQRLSVSHDIQIASAYFSQDVANTGLRTGAYPTYTPAQSIWVNSAAPPCATGLGNAVVLMKWDDWADSNGIGTHSTSSAAYVVEPVGSGHLHRVACSDTTLVSDVMVVHNYVPGATTTVVCYPGVHNTHDVPADVPVLCTSSPPPTTVELTIQIKAAPNDTSGTTTTLAGQRRQSSS